MFTSAVWLMVDCLIEHGYVTKYVFCVLLRKRSGENEEIVLLQFNFFFSNGVQIKVKDAVSQGLFDKGQNSRLSAHTQL